MPLSLYVYRERGIFLVILVTSPSGDDPRRVQRCPDQEDQQHQPGEVAWAGAEDLLDQAQGGVAVGAAQEHEIGAAQMVDQGGGQHVEAKDPEHFGQAADVGAEAPGQQKHREQHQHGVHRAGVQVHDVPQGHSLPGRKEQGRRCAGQAEGVEHLSGQTVGAPGVPHADEQVDAA